jgi:predicted nucleic acid-binding protein
MADSEIVYLDASALVKLVVVEAESRALRAFLRGRPRRASSAIAAVEVERNVRRQGNQFVRDARRMLALLNLVPLERGIRDAAAAIEPLTLRSLDAIHLASALALGDDLDAIVTYDLRMQTAARDLGLTVVAPA